MIRSSWARRSARAFLAVCLVALFVPSRTFGQGPAPGDPLTGERRTVYAPHESSLPRAADPSAAAPAAVPRPATPAPAAKPAPAVPAGPRPVALFVSGCANVADAGVRKIIAVELGARLNASGSATPADADRLLVSCHGQVARIEAGDPATPRYAERTLPLDQFHGAAAANRAVGLAALELLAALDHLRPPPPKEPPPSSPPPTAAPAPANNAAVDAYQQGFVWFYDSTTVGLFGRKWSPYQGKYHQPLHGTDFYGAVDRPDLVSRYNRKRGVQIGVVLVGVGASLYGLSQYQSRSGLALGLFLGGALAVQIGLFLDVDPVDESEARRLADVHNKGLKRRLGLTRAGPQGPVPGWRLAAGLAPGGGSVGATLEF